MTEPVPKLEHEEKRGMGWMYGGSETIVDRERYLLGQSIDKNFELFSKEQNAGPVTQLDTVLSSRAGGKPVSGFKSKAAHDEAAMRNLLKLDTVRKEDPLVAIKIKQEQTKEEALNNPLQKMKLQKLVKKAMEKKVKKLLKKQAKAEQKAAKQERKSKRSRSSSTSSDDEVKPSRHHERSSTSSQKRRSPSPPRRRHSPERRRDRDHRRSRHDTPSEHGRRRRHDSRSSSRSASPKRSRPSSSKLTVNIKNEEGYDSDELKRKLKFAGYGLVKSANASGSSSRPPPIDVKPVVSKKTELTSAHRATHARPKLTDEEKAARLAAMSGGNVEWRESQRSANLSKVAAMDREEVERNEKGSRTEGVDFLRPMMDKASDSSTLEDSLQRRKAKIQRHGDTMQKSFVRR